MKRKLLLLFFILSTLPFSGVQAQQTGTYTANGHEWKYQLNGTEAVITGMVRGNDWSYWYSLPNNAPLILPATIEIGSQSYPVTKIADGAFNQCRDMKGILSIPSSVVEIGNNAFRGCEKLDGVVSLSGIKKFGDYAFYRCLVMEGSMVLSSAETIGKYAFSSCGKLRGNLSLDNVTSVGENAFESCQSLTSLQWPAHLTTIEKGVFSYCRGLTGPLSLPHVTEIKEWAFSQTSFTSLSLPLVTHIGSNAFSMCNSFTGTLSLPEAIYVGSVAFANCNGFTQLSIPKLTTIEAGAFSYITTFTGTLSLPEVTSIGNEGFAGCEGLTQINIPKLQTLDEQAFGYCNGFTDIELPATVTQIGNLAFGSCDNLRTFKLKAGTTLTSIGRSVFDHCRRLAYVDFTKATLPTTNILVQRAFSSDYTRIAPFSSASKNTMIYLPAGYSVAPKPGEENFVVGNQCENFAIYDIDENPYEGDVYCEYPIQYAFTAAKATYKRTFSGTTCKTLCLPYASTLPTGMQAYELKLKKGSTSVRFVPIAGTALEANKPYLVRITAGTPVFGTETNVSVPVSPTLMEVQATEDANVFFGGTTQNIANADAATRGLYNLNNDVWLPIQTADSKGLVRSCRAYIRFTGGAPAKSFALVLDDENETTAIDGTEKDIEQSTTPIYTLDGKLAGTSINALKSGEIYIRSGKKFYKF